VQNLLYILSPSFSGSTLLTFLLAAHPEIATVGELKASSMGDIDNYRCSCGALLKECSFWKKVKKGMEDKDIPFSFAEFGTNFNCGSALFRRLIRLSAKSALLLRLGPRLFNIPPSYRTQLERILEQNSILIELITKIQGAGVFLDGSKDPERLNQLLISRRWKIKVIHLLRDGRGIANSYMKHYNVDMRSAAREWVSTETTCERVLSGISPKNAMTVKYEEICQNSQQTLDRVLEFTGLGLTTLESQKPASHCHILGNNAARLSFCNSVITDEKWKRELLEEELNDFELIAGAMNRRNGYG